MYSDTAPSSGGLANVYWLPDVSSGELDALARMLLRSTDPGATLVCVTGDQNQYFAESYSTAGKRIQFCGHGALAAAWLIFEQHQQDQSELIFANHRHSWQAKRIDSSIADIAVTYDRPLPVICDVPDFAEACLGALPVAAAKVGGDTDYLILELENEKAVKNLAPDVPAIVLASQRAFIVTAPTDGNSPDYVLRYFAPQYGDPEDAATGSAAVQLAAYWGQKVDAKEFTARQLSLQGATMQLSCSADTVELAARVAYG